MLARADAAGGQHPDRVRWSRQTLASPLISVPLLIPVLSSLPVWQQHRGFGMVLPSQGSWQGHFQQQERVRCGAAVPSAGGLVTGGKHCLATALALELNRAEGV